MREIRSFGVLLSAMIAVLALFSTARAEPWIEAGDARMRGDIELLAAYGLIDGPITMWPLPWAQVTRSLASMPDRSFPFHVEAALARVRAKVPTTSDYRSLGIETHVGATSREKLVRGFDGGVRENAEASVSLEKHWGSSYAKLSIGGRDGQPGSDVSFDNSYFAQAFGNWVAYAGTLDQWWGGGWDGGMILSNNARPFPRIGFQRLDPKPFDTKWLSWLGNWNVNFTLGQLDSGATRTDFNNIMMAHIRVTFQPFDRLDIGFNRAIQTCGSGRDCGFSNWVDALIGFGDLDNTGTPDEPGNQIAGADIRYSDVIGDFSYGLYAETIAEDENQPIVDKYSLLLGATLGGYWEGQQLQWRLRVEASDTIAGNIFGLGRDVRPNVTFSNFIFTDGFEFLDRTIGHNLSTDSQLYTLETSFVDRHDRSYWLRYRRAKINAFDGPRNEVSANREVINLVEIGAEGGFGRGFGRLEMRIMDDRANTPGRNDFDAQIEASLNWRF
ncbi:outer membrane protein in capsule/EPS biosynthesis locus [Iodidimonas nitroreducens]|uniref:Outer membrane protein in capsule/EPS biosynthesis locus n=1 Tax=Iodidimonas nitroreducens TaxID=1236968 RepID=A0A5A7NC09_9PROT|nr:capsule assembly Wzi family protein [Iodidimonas nitroreducens]GAK32592.1 putative 55.8 kDa protein in cps region [alpha proteobacterium Q-1]GER04506.1 outer membrane protein in capsule/EPS biosynthesis locus [Iodidimonas nitroreducens]